MAVDPESVGHHAAPLIKQVTVWPMYGVCMITSVVVQIDDLLKDRQRGLMLSSDATMMIATANVLR